MRDGTVFVLMTFRGSFRRFRIRSFILRCARLVFEVIVVIIRYSFINSVKMLEACLTYETGILDRQGFEVSNDPVWILGRQYDTKTRKYLHCDFNICDIKGLVNFRYGGAHHRC